MDTTTNISVVQCVSAHRPALPCMQAGKWPQSYSSIPWQWYAKEPQSWT